MSFLRLIYWTALIGGWAAFLGWLITEIPFHWWIDEGTGIAIVLAILMSTFVAIAIGGGVSMASGLSNPGLASLLQRFLFGAGGGLIGGFVASLSGACVFYMFERIFFLGLIARVFGWALIGILVGLTVGLYDRDFKKIRNGLIGGAIGGVLAGLFFIPIQFVIGSPMSSRAFAFVLLGVSIGLFIGLAQVLLKESWLTVEQGFRAGRQLILGGDAITMGTSEKASLIFIAYGAKGVEPIHLTITRQEDGSYLLEDNKSRTGTLLNGQPVTKPTKLLNGDRIQFGVNVVVFNERVKRSESERLPPAEVKAPAPAGAIAAGSPPAKPATTPAITAAPAPAPKPIPVAAPAAPAPVATAAPKPATPPQPQEGRCPICDRKIVGIPGERRCGKCFTTF